MIGKWWMGGLKKNRTRRNTKKPEKTLNSLKW